MREVKRKTVKLLIQILECFELFQKSKIVQIFENVIFFQILKRVQKSKNAKNYRNFSFIVFCETSLWTFLNYAWDSKYEVSRWINLFFS